MHWNYPILEHAIVQEVTNYAFDPSQFSAPDADVARIEAEIAVINDSAAKTTKRVEALLSLGELSSAMVETLRKANTDQRRQEAELAKLLAQLGAARSKQPATESVALIKATLAEAQGNDPGKLYAARARINQALAEFVDVIEFDPKHVIYPHEPTIVVKMAKGKAMIFLDRAGDVTGKLTSTDGFIDGIMQSSDVDSNIAKKVAAHRRSKT